MPTQSTQLTVAEVEKQRPTQYKKMQEFIDALDPKLNLSDAIKFLTVKMQADERQVVVNETITGFPLDILYNLWRVIDTQYGYKEALGTPGWFGNTPPEFMAIPSDANGNTVEILTGQFRLPGVEGVLTAHPQESEGLILQYEGKAKDMYHVKELASLTRSTLAVHSLYRGKAIKLNSANVKNDMVMPEFMDMTKGHETLILNAEVEKQITTAMRNPLFFGDRYKRYGIPLKQSTLLGGPYGTGKTLTAKFVARWAIENGYTFMYVKNAKDLILAFGIAKIWGKTVLFVEDIDQIATDAEMVQKLSLILDGIDTKHSELMLVMTTNHEDKMPPILMRDGRIDNFIHVGLPDADSIRRLVAFYAVEPRTGQSLLSPEIDWEEIGAALSGNLPSQIRGIVEHAKGSAIEHDPLVLSTDDILAAARLRRRHAEMSQIKPEDDSAPVRLAVALQEVIFGQTLKDEDDAAVDLAPVMAGLRQIRRQLDTKSPVDHTKQLTRIEETVETIKENQ